ncbi:MAG: metallophosphoesterase [Deltaproteobacteria bacterium]|nr:metallophosphoesterase [Deltaproteobacteria bacterium]
MPHLSRPSARVLSAAPLSAPRPSSPLTAMMACCTLLSLSAAASAAPTTTLAKVSLRPAQLHSVKLVMVGDTGEPPSTEGCGARADGSAPLGASCHASAAQREALRAAIVAEQADAIFALGDLVYPKVPACDGEVDGVKKELDAVLGDLFAPAGQRPPPTFLVLGNHDVGHLRGRNPKRERCLMAYAAKHGRVQLPALQYEVDVGFGKVVVIDSNLRDQDLLPASTVKAAMDNPLSAWTLVLSHHELRTAWDKELDGFWEPPPPGRWLIDQGLRPDLWVNGHAHSLQFGVYDARVVDQGRPVPNAPADPVWVPALTSGAGSKVRPGPSCSDWDQTPGRGAQIVADRAACKDAGPRGAPAFARHQLGYAVVTLSAEQMLVEIKDLGGQRLYCWARTPGDPKGAVCGAEGTPAP